MPVIELGNKWFQEHACDGNFWDLGCTSWRNKLSIKTSHLSPLVDLSIMFVQKSRPVLLTAMESLPAPETEKRLFPQILHDLLEEMEREGKAHIVAWNPDGLSFKVRDKASFTQHVLPRYFRQSQYKSFVRQLNIWGFSCVGQGPSRGAYKHVFFVRGRRDLCKHMTREKIKGNKAKGSTHVSDGACPSLLDNDTAVTSGGATPTPAAFFGGQYPFPMREASFPDDTLLQFPTTQPEYMRLSEDYSNINTVPPITMGPSTSFFPSRAQLLPTTNESTSSEVNNPTSKNDWLSSLENNFEISAASPQRTHRVTTVDDLEPRPFAEIHRVHANSNLQHRASLSPSGDAVSESSARRGGGGGRYDDLANNNNTIFDMNALEDMSLCIS